MQKLVLEGYRNKLRLMSLLQTIVSTVCVFDKCVNILALYCTRKKVNNFQVVLTTVATDKCSYLGTLV